MTSTSKQHFRMSFCLNPVSSPQERGRKIGSLHLDSDCVCLNLNVCADFQRSSALITCCGCAMMHCGRPTLIMGQEHYTDCAKITKDIHILNPGMYVYKDLSARRCELILFLSFSLACPLLQLCLAAIRNLPVMEIYWMFSGSVFPSRFSDWIMIHPPLIQHPSNDGRVYWSNSQPFYKRPLQLQKLTRS